QNSNRHKWSSSEQAQTALEWLVKAGLGRWEEAPARAGGGRLTQWFVLIVQTENASEPSDTSRGQSEQGSDTSSDTSPSGAEYGTSQFSRNGYPHGTSGERAASGGEEVSEVSEGKTEKPLMGAEGTETEVSEGHGTDDLHGDAWEHPLDRPPG